MTDIRDALLRAILVDPTDDIARLVLADHHEENGEGERAEFVRVQVELARLDRKEFDHDLRRWNSKEANDSTWRLARRQKKLFEQFKTRWFDERAAIYYLGEEEEDAEGQYPDLTRAIVRRGFVSAVRTTLADWVGGPCERCRGQGFLGHPAPGQHGFIGTPKCPLCKGVARTPAHGPRIVAEQPVEEVRTEKVPIDNRSVDSYFDGDPHSPADQWFWIRYTGPVENQTEWQVPAEIYDLMPGDGSFDSPELAQSALSLALLNWARREAGLPPLEERT